MIRLVEAEDLTIGVDITCVSENFWDNLLGSTISLSPYAETWFVINEGHDGDDIKRWWLQRPNGERTIAFTLGQLRGEETIGIRDGMFFQFVLTSLLTEEDLFHLKLIGNTIFEK